MDAQVNPFLGRSAVDRPEDFVGRRQELWTIAQLVGAAPPASAVVTGIRRIGRTSLLNVVMHPDGMREQYGKAMVHGIHQLVFVYVDGGATAGGPKRAPEAIRERLLGAMNEALCRQCLALPNRNEPRQTIGNGGLHEALKAVEDNLRLLEREGRIVIFVLDDADEIIRAGVGDVLRPLTSYGLTAFMLSTTHTVDELDPEGEMSWLFGVATPVHIGLLSDAESNALLDNGLQRAGVEHALCSEDRRRILEYGGGHPDFLRVAARVVFEDRVVSGHTASWEQLTWDLERELEVTCRSIWRDFKRRWERPEDKQHEWILQEKTALEAIALRKPLTSSLRHAMTRLADWGLVRETGAEGWRMFSPIFERYLQREYGAALSSNDLTQVPGTYEERRHSNLVFVDDGVEVEGRWVSLTRLQLSLLRHLYQHVGETTTRDDILQAVWKREPGEEPEEAGTVNVAIQRLRQTLREAVGDRLIIEAVRSSSQSKGGYRLVIM